MSLIHQYNSLIRPANDPAATDRLLRVLVDLTPEDQHDFWFRDGRAGAVCLYRNEEIAPGKVLEYVQGSREDSITTLYNATELFQSRRRLIDTRNQIITEIAAGLMSLPDAVGFWDEGRERDVRLKEMGTAQLIDQWARIQSVNLEAIA